MERVVKGLMGYSAEKEGKPATHIILTVEEYKNLTAEIKRTQLKVEQTENYYSSEMRKYKRQCDEALREEQEKAQESVRASQELLNSAKGEIGRLNDLNANLLRISRERANAKRGLKPKKVHHGYIVLDNQQSSYNKRFYNGRRMLSTSFPCWKLRIQSPYDSSIPFSIITKNIHDDLINFLGDALNINSIYKVSTLDNASLDEIEKLWDNKDINFIFNTSYKSNYRTGLWEVEYMVRASVIVPEDMRKII